MVFTASINEVDNDFNSDYLRKEYVVEIGLSYDGQYKFIQMISSIGDQAFSIAKAAEFLEQNYNKYEDYLLSQQWKDYFSNEHWPIGYVIETVSVFFYDDKGVKYEFSEIDHINF